MKKLVFLLLLASSAIYAVDRPENEEEFLPVLEELNDEGDWVEAQPSAPPLEELTNNQPKSDGTFWSGLGKGCAMSAAAGALFVLADYALLATGRLIGETSAYRRTVDRPACYRWGLGLGGLSAGLSVIYDYCKGDLLKPFKCETAAEKLGMFTASVASFLTACFLLKK